MSTLAEEKIINRNSAKLCMLINDRIVSDEISGEIKGLIEKGVDVNFQDANENNNTALHLAIANKDKRCVKFLLELNPDLGIKNDNQETLEDLAMKLKQSEIIQLLLDHQSLSFKSKRSIEDSGETSGHIAKKLKTDTRFINKKFTCELNFENIDINRIKVDESLRVLKIVNCLSVSDVICFNEFFKKSTHLFLILIESKVIGKDFDLKSFIELFDDDRPLIVQIIVDGNPVIYIKEEGDECLTELEKFQDMNKEEFLKRMNDYDTCNMQTLLNGFNSKNFGNFDKDLMHIQVEFEIIERLAHASAKQNNNLCLRFLQLLLKDSEDLSDIVPMTDSSEYIFFENLLTFLELPFSTSCDSVINFSAKQQKKLIATDNNGCDLLMLAIENYNVNAFKFLLKNGSNVHRSNFNGDTAVNLAWEGKRYELIVHCLEADSMFPTQNFTADDLKPQEEESEDLKEIKLNITRIIEHRASFHKLIRNGSVQEVNDFMNENYRLKVVHDKTNKSALTVSLEAKQLEIYSLLISQGFSSGFDENIDNCLAALTKKERNIIRRCNRQYFKESEDSHLLHLLSRTMLASNLKKKEECFKVIRQMYEELNKCSEVKAVMKTVGQPEKLEIIFDFQKTHVRDIDPDATGGTKGRADYITGSILIAAKNHDESAKSFSEIVGVIAHELTHYAMQLIYENQTNPYKSNDTTNRERFQIITNELEAYQQENHTNRIIQSTFLYHKDDWHNELIVRVPHLAALYRNDEKTLIEIRETYCKALFAFYEEVTLKDLETQSDLIRLRKEIEKFNQIDGLLKTLKGTKVRLNDSKFDDCKSLVDRECKILLSNTPDLTLSSIRQNLLKTHGNHLELEHLFVKHESTTNLERLKIIKFVHESKLRPLLIVDCTKPIFNFEKLNLLINVLGFCERLIIVTVVEDSNDFSKNSDFDKFKIVKLNHVWEDLSEASKEVGLKTLVNFQGKSVPLYELLLLKTELSKELDLYKVFNQNSEIAVGIEVCHKNNDFVQSTYIERSFCFEAVRHGQNSKYNDEILNSSESFSNNYFDDIQNEMESEISTSDFLKRKRSVLSTDELLKRADQTKVTIISDVAGTGKSTALFHIAKRYKDNDHSCWVSLIDLKEHIKVFEKLKQCSQQPDFIEFLWKHILKLEVTFDRELFCHLFQSGKVILCFDGFDEISPYFKVLVLEQMKNFDASSGNQLWITTRAHLQEDLERCFEQLPCSILPLTKEDQIQFLMSSKTDEKTSISLEAATRLIENFSTTKTSKNRDNFIGIPLQLQMIAEIYKHDDTSFDLLNRFTIFEKFIDKIVLRWISQGEIAQTEQVEFHRLVHSPKSIHYQIALQYFFREQKQTYDKNDWPNEKIARIGFVTFDKNENPRFLHETFAEFFVADFIFNQIKTQTPTMLPDHVLRLCHAVLSEENHQMIRSFLDSAMSKLMGSERVVVENFKPILKQNKNFFFIVHLIQEEFENIVSIILNTIAEDVIEAQSKRTNETSSICAVTESSSESSISDDFKTFLTKTKLFVFLTLHQSEKVFVKLFEIVRKLFNNNEMKTLLSENSNKFNIFHYAVCNGKDEKAFTTILKIAKSILSEDQIRTMLKEKTTEENSMLRILLMNNKSKKTLEAFLNAAKQVLSDEEIKETFIKMKGSCKYNALQTAAIYNNELVIKALFTIIKSFLNESEMKAHLMESSKDRSNIFHIAVQNGKHETAFITIFDSVKGILSKDQIRIMLRENTTEENSVLDILLINNKSEKTLKGFLDAAKQVFNDEEIKEMFKEKATFNDFDALQTAAIANNELIIKALFTIIKSFLNESEKEAHLMESTENRSNIFHIAVCNGKHKTAFTTIFEIAKSILSKDQIRTILREKTTEGNSVLHILLINSKSEKTLEGFLDAAKQVLNDEEIKEMFKEKATLNNYNALQRAAIDNNKLVIKALFTIIKSFLNESEMKAHLMESTENRSNIFHIAMCNVKHKKAFTTVFDLAKSILSKDQIRTMLREKTIERNSVFQILLINKSEKTLEAFLDAAKQVLSYYEIKKMLLEMNINHEDYA